MSAQHNGGPAFPTVKRTAKKLVRVEGMLLRDYFAAKALPHAWAQFDAAGNDSDTVDDVADTAYGMADAMLRRRLK